MYLQLPIVAGVGAASTGLRRAILAAAGAGPLDAGPRAAIYGGVALYLFAAAAMPAAGARPHANRIRLAAALGALVLVFVGRIVAPVYQVSALATLFGAEIAVELPHRHVTRG
jgi:hypothetical protein